MAGRRARPVKKFSEARVVVGIEDMVLIQDTKDAGIVANLKQRLKAEQIYTNIGHVLVVCNPYKWLPIYEEVVMKQYIQQQRVDVTPHIFATAEAAYRSMITEEDNQCVIISGESGAGKTEASKQIQAYIAKVSGGGEGVDKIKSVFLESNPVLEAFGNAKTLRNNNSSRFGKYFELKFDRFGCPVGGLITNYLLEKSRICRPNEGERNFHIFYQLIASEFSEGLGLGSCADFEYISCSTCRTVDGMDDSSEFDVTINALRSVGMKNTQIKSVLSLVAAVLHLGNIKFQSQQVEGVEGCKVLKSSSLTKACELLSISPGEVEAVLTFRELQTMAPGGKIDTYQIPQHSGQAAARRDALAKAIFEKLFDLIVSRINVALDPAKQATAAAAEDDPSYLSIGVLDIYGFEVFETNGFEQLCINYVNEKLQQIFIELTLNAEQLEYSTEGIAWEPIPFFNNKIVCDLLDGSRPPGLFRVLDDTCKTMHGTKAGTEIDKKFLESGQQIHGSNPHFQQTSSYFVIKHYAGEVKYKLGKLAESNKDALNNDLLLLLKSSGDKLMQHMFSDIQVDVNDKKSTVPSAGMRIRSQCQQLVTSLMECQPHYVRCIKSNDAKAALTIDQDRAVHQVKYLGLSENIKVRRAGFAYRAEYHRFLDRFNILSKATYPEYKGTDQNGCKEILKVIAKSIPHIKEEAQFGRSKLFIRKPETYFQIEKLRELRMEHFVIAIQSAWRRYSGRRVLVQLYNVVNGLYLQENKSRRRDSIYRPFTSDYLAAVGTDLLEPLKEAIYRVIDHYSNTETILFADASCSQILSTAAPPHYVVENRIIVLTTAAIYVMEHVTAEKWAAELRRQNLPLTKKQPALVFLRRRVALTNSAGGLEAVQLSRCADSFVVLSVKPSAAQQRAAPLKDNWTANNTAKVCPLTGESFTLFNRRHHCRVSGDIVVSSVSDYKQLLPDIGWAAVPQRVSDPYVGLVSTDPLEDLVLIMSRKTEFASLVSIEWQKVNGRPAVLPSGSSKKGSSSPTEGAHSNVLKGLQFENRFLLRHCNVADGASRLPGNEINFSENTSPHPTNKSKNAPLAPEFVVQFDNNRLNIQVPQGLSQAVVRERRARQLERQKKADARRRREDKERQARRAEREIERENDRLQRLAEKKARKAQDKEAKRIAEEEKLNASSVAAANKGGRRFGATPSPTPGDSEASGKDSRRNSPTPMDNSSSGGSGRTSPKNAPTAGDNRPPPPRFGGGPGGSAAPSSAASELAAAMAKRRAKADA